MDNLVSLVNKIITAEMFYEIKNSEMYGGEGSIGYAKQEMGGIPFENHDKLTDELLQKTCEDVARILKINPENIRMISKEEYDQNVEEDESDADDPDEEDDE